MLLIKNADVYAPAPLGKKDVLICQGKIEFIADNIPALGIPCHVVDGSDLIMTPGFIDQHIHVTGGGGEGSFHTRTPELMLSELIEGGVTTVVGLLGTDGLTRSTENLYAKTRALNEEGVTAFMLTGSYSSNGPYITGSADKDIVFIKEVLGMKLALSDHRAPNVSLDKLIRMASDVRVAGMLADKPGFITLHMGDANSALDPIFEILANTAIPIKTFRPTHVNRNPNLLEHGYKLLEEGGYVDYTCRMPGQPTPGKCILKAKERKLPLNRITISSDGHGSWSNYDSDGTLLEIGVAKVDSLYHEFRSMVRELHMPVEEALTYITSNVADGLHLSGCKGRVQESMDADLLLFTKDLTLHSVIAQGELMMKEGTLLKQGTYENIIS